LIAEVKNDNRINGALYCVQFPLTQITQVFVEKPEGKRPLGRPRRRWEHWIRIDLREIGWGVWIGFDWLRTGTGGELL
jgi:hypothetical protein